MDGTAFLVERVFESGGRGYVVARLLDPQMTFEVAPGATLGGCRVERWLEMPRAIDANGAQRQDLFGFSLADLADLARIRTGDQVTLT